MAWFLLISVCASVSGSDCTWFPLCLIGLWAASDNLLCAISRSMDRSNLCKSHNLDMLLQKLALARRPVSYFSSQAMIWIFSYSNVKLVITKKELWLKSQKKFNHSFEEPWKWISEAPLWSWSKFRHSSEEPEGKFRSSCEELQGKSLQPLVQYQRRKRRLGRSGGAGDGETVGTCL